MVLKYDDYLRDRDKDMVAKLKAVETEIDLQLMRTGSWSKAVGDLNGGQRLANVIETTYQRAGWFVKYVNHAEGVQWDPYYVTHIVVTDVE